jgi:hypothetical protein
MVAWVLLFAGQISQPSAQLLESKVIAATGAMTLELMTELSARSRIELLQKDISQMRVRWPAGSVVAAAVGFSVTAALVLGIPLLVVGFTSAGSVASSFFAIGAFFSGIGGIGLIVALIGVVSGVNAERNAKEARQVLIDERDDLKRWLKEQPPGRPQEIPPPPSPTVYRDLQAVPLFTLAHL